MRQSIAMVSCMLVMGSKPVNESVLGNPWAAFNRYSWRDVALPAVFLPGRGIEVVAPGRLPFAVRGAVLCPVGGLVDRARVTGAWVCVTDKASNLRMLLADVVDALCN